MKKISVIIPVYNGEKYINRCVDSVLNQQSFDIKSLEILLLNDGSSDNSEKIINEYAKSFPGIIKAMSHKNMGVAKTRNKGINLARGTYVLFIDHDDWIDPCFCKELFKKAIETGADVVVAGYRRVVGNGKIIKTRIPNNYLYSKSFLISAAWGKLHKREFLKKNKIIFFDSNIGEDILFTLWEYKHWAEVCSINYIGYNWYWNNKSVSNTVQRGLKEEINFTNLINKILPLAIDKYSEYFLMQTVIHYILFSGRSSTPTKFTEFEKNMFNLLDSSKIEYYHFLFWHPRGTIWSVKLSVFLYLLIRRLRLIKIFAKFYCRGLT